MLILFNGIKEDLNKDRLRFTTKHQRLNNLEMYGYDTKSAYLGEVEYGNVIMTTLKKFVNNNIYTH